MKEYIEKSVVERMLWVVIMAKDERTIEEMLEYAPTVQAIPISEGATNGDVIKVLFPNISVYEHGSTYSVNNEYNFNSTWWNAPYKKEVEE